MLLDGEEWARLLYGFEHSAFRLEIHPVYSMEGEEEDFTRFRAGERPPADLHYDWLDRVAELTAAGRSMTRVHVVRRPLSEYLRFEFDWGYAFNVRAGEDIRILDLTDGPSPALPDHDFWLFDDSTVVQMHYRADGTQIGRELAPAPDLELYRGYRDAALADAVNFKEYWPGT